MQGVAKNDMTWILFYTLLRDKNGVREPASMQGNLSLASARIVLLAMLIAALGMLVACERKSQSAPPKVVTVTIHDFKFEPEKATVHEGDTVEWKNTDSVAHTATTAGEGQKPTFDSGSIATGATWRYVAGAKGSYNYTCTFHPYMKGELIIQ